MKLSHWPVMIAACAALMLGGCVCGLEPIEEEDAGAPASDAGVGLDTATGQDTATGVDTYQPPTDAATGQDTATGVDTYQPPSDAGAGLDQASGADTYQPPSDAAVIYDAARPDVGNYDAEGLSGLGESCSAVACEPVYTCVGDNPDYFCRVPCTPDVPGTCDPATEFCISITGTAGGACVPGNTLGETCFQSDPDNDPCSELYICVTQSGQSNYLCRETCDPSVDGGCPEAGPCWAVGSSGGGACF